MRCEERKLQKGSCVWGWCLVISEPLNKTECIFQTDSIPWESEKSLAALYTVSQENCLSEKRAVTAHTIVK